MALIGGSYHINTMALAHSYHVLPIPHTPIQNQTNAKRYQLPDLINTSKSKAAQPYRNQ
jgi:hypothetical protein